MSADALLAEKLSAYRSLFEHGCGPLFDGDDALTVELDDDDEPAAISNGGSNSPVTVDAERGAAAKAELLRALREIAQDFAGAFNAKLTAAAKEDASVGMVAENYEMTTAHVDELVATLAAAVKPLVDKLDAGDVAAARRTSVDSWPLLERRLRSKWQAYFVFTFQDVSVERKAARDRRKLQQRFDPESAPIVVQPNAKLRAMSDLAPLDAAKRSRSPWIAVLAVLLLAAAGGWLLLRHGHASAAPAAATKR
jgi:hypothetical protein